DFVFNSVEDVGNSPPRQRTPPGVRHRYSTPNTEAFHWTQPLQARSIKRPSLVANENVTHVGGVAVHRTSPSIKWMDSIARDRSFQ
ncbi:hypothetical protein TNCT_65501, partial [Trichonephila clavata]